MSQTTETWSPFLNPPYTGWAPYCLMCSTMARMKPTDYGWKCVACGNPIDRTGKHWNGAPLTAPYTSVPQSQKAR